VNELVDKDRAIFESDVPDVDEQLTNQLILNEIRQAFAALQHQLLGSQS
jgi:hypothetical protein